VTFVHKPENRNLFENFRAYPNGFAEFGKWRDHHLEMHQRHSLGVPEFGAKWLHRWSEVGRLFASRVEIQHWNPRQTRWIRVGRESVAECLLYCVRYDAKYVKCRIVLLDGTIVKEWGAE